ncbi:MAG: tetraacyldisaccharide 4'-kinase [Thermodesulfobacteriota bacterium]
MPYLSAKIANLISQEKESCRERILLSPLTFLSFFYKQIVATRIFFYAAGVKRVKTLPQKVISVGNITVGGTGKTPMVMSLAEMLRENAFPISILSRGYKGKWRRKIFLVADQEKIWAEPEDCGDEPYLLAKKLPGIPIIVGQDRYLCGLYALQNFKSKILILDDGFQYLSLKRDLNLLLLDSTLPFGNGWLFPRGILREPINQVKRADAVILTKAGQSANISILKDKLLKIKNELPIFTTDYVPHTIWMPDGRFYPSEFLRGKKVLAFCGIGRPQSFKETLIKLEPKFLGMEIFPDHHWYKEKDWQRLCAKAKMMDAEFLLTTEKDGVRLQKFPPGTVPWGVLSVRHSFLNDDGIKFKKFVFSKLGLDS